MRDYPPEYNISVPRFNDGVDFFSRFESANLRKAIRVSRTEYELLLSEDFNTAGHFHWYYFKTVSRLPAGTTVRFKILNMAKPNSLYSVGFRPFVFSTKRHQATRNLRLSDMT